jgi:hypothetical protein
MKNVVAFAALAMLVPMSQAQPSCPEDISAITSRIPRYGNPQLASIRSKLEAMSVRQAVRSAKSQGLTAQAAVEASMQQARSYDSVVRQATSCAADTDAFGTTDDQFLESLNSSSLRNVSCDGVRGSCLCAAIINKMAAVGTRALAGGMRCFAAQGLW